MENPRETVSANAEGSICTPQKRRRCLSSYFTVLCNRQCNFSITNIRFQTVLLHFFLPLKRLVWFKFFNLKLQILSAYQRKASDKHLALSCLPQAYHTQGLPDGLLQGPTGPGKKYLSSCNFKEETVFFVQSHENLHRDTIYQKLYLLLCMQPTDHTLLITIIILQVTLSQVYGNINGANKNQNQT